MFFERIETDTEIVIVHKPYFIYIFLFALLLWLVAGLLPENGTVKSLSGFAWLAAIAILLWRYLTMRHVWHEMSEAMKKGTVTMSGSKLNPSNPLTVRIPKTLLRKSEA